MTPRKTKNLRMPTQPSEPLRVVNPAAAAIDVHSEVHWVCVPSDRDPQPVQKFGSFTIDLEAIADFLARCRITGGGSGIGGRRRWGRWQLTTPRSCANLKSASHRLGAKTSLS